jgi:hypothetical protein
MRIARADGRRFRLVLAFVECTPDRPEAFLVAAVFEPDFEEVFAAALDAEVAAFSGVDGESEV